MAGLKEKRKPGVGVNQTKEKIYTVNVTFIKLNDEEAKIKRNIIESIIKKGWKNNL